MNQKSSIELLKDFLKEMFQFNANDLDFGIYRIYNLKRKEIEHFINGADEQCLEPIITQTLELVTNLEKQTELTGLATYLKRFNQESLVNDPAGNFQKIEQLVLNFGTESEKQTLIATLNTSTQSFDITDEIKDKIYNHILGYFEMYYANGDFGYNNRSRTVYKVPYEADYDGNDTLFHWKHKGSLYIKTGSAFNAIRFKLKHLDKEFEMRLETNEDSKGEEVARNSNKDTKLKHYKFNRFEDVDGVTRIVFNLSDSSTTKAELFKDIFKSVLQSAAPLDKYLFADGKPVFNDLTEDYDKVVEGSVKGIGDLRLKRKTIQAKINKNFDKGAKIELVAHDGQERFSDETLETLYNLDQKLNSFYIGNDSDYFIHENLLEFLTQEKERYIKNYILSDLKSILDGKLDNTTIIIAKAFDLVSGRIIEFLSVIEEFQKKLFTMKKKVVESEYCLTIDNIDEKYYPEILQNPAQLTEWENLFGVPVKTADDLKAQPTLVLDTKFFKQPDGTNTFKDNLLAGIDNLDERTNGLLINSENYQALKLLQDRLKKQIDVIYIDPPYNTGSDDFLYKDNFKHSSWMTFVINRLEMCKNLFSSRGLFFTSIDDNELFQLRHALDTVFSSDAFSAQIIIQSNKRGQTYQEIAKTHEYLLTYSVGELSQYIELPKEFTNQSPADERGYFELWELRNRNPKFGKHNRPNLYYPIYIDPNTIDAEGFATVSLKKDKNFSVEVFPLNSKGTESCWRWDEDKLQSELNQYGKLAVLGKKKKDGKYNIYEKARKVTKKAKSIWMETDVINEHGTVEVGALGLQDFGFPKPLGLLEKVIKISCEKRATVLDFFAGSGTTGHAVLLKNKEDKEANMKYILVEMGNYFEHITKKRIQKVIFSQNWKDGKPIGNDGSKKHIFKYFVLEQYEDVLDAVEPFTDDLPKNLPLKYLYKPEINQINSSLDLSRPFANRVNYGQPTKEGYVDLVDTYNYLQGYEVKSLKTYTLNGKYYKVVETLNTLVVWRDIALGEDDSAVLQEIVERYPDITRLEVNHDFNILATLKDKQLPVSNRIVSLSVIHADVFNQ